MANELQVSLQSSEGLKRTLRVEIPAEQIDGEITKRLKQVGKKAKLKGFRPGKAPLNVIRQNYGSEVRNEVLGDMMQKTYAQAISQEQIQPAGNPNIKADEHKEGNAFAYTAEVEVYPEISLQGLDSLSIEKPVAKITDQDVDLIIDNMRHQKANWETANRKARENDRVTIDFEGSIDGEAFPGGKAESTPVILGEGRMLPDFEKGLVGIKAGEVRNIDVNFPEDYHAEDLKGKKAVFEISAEVVEEKVLPEIDTEFCQAFGVESGDIDELRTEVRANMQKELDGVIEAKTKDNAMTALLEANPLDVPQALVGQEIHSLQHDMQRRMGLPDDHSYHPPAEQFIDEATRRVRLGLLIGEYVKQEELKVEKQEIEQQLDKMTDGYEDAETMKNAYRGNQQAMQQLNMMALEAKVVENLLTKATVTEQANDFQTLMEVKPLA
ncbi:MAG: trigger factor [Gammaproteobacteria bacterium]|nr:trigger factor [Gammaproteobacteria bacterium]NNC98135.1 trigger factor [Gammaproteobacteria bacterium]NNM12961.1 trigger factor [Gammaproteobacteria bacterium]